MDELGEWGGGWVDTVLVSIALLENTGTSSDAAKRNRLYTHLPTGFFKLTLSLVLVIRFRGREEEAELG